MQQFHSAASAARVPPYEYGLRPYATPGHYAVRPSKFSPEEQDTIISVIDGLLLKHEAQR